MCLLSEIHCQLSNHIQYTATLSPHSCPVFGPHGVVYVHVCVCQVIVHEVPGQELEVEVFDKDPDNDDFLGR